MHIQVYLNRSLILWTNCIFSLQFLFLNFFLKFELLNIFIITAAYWGFVWQVWSSEKLNKVVASHSLRWMSAHQVGLHFCLDYDCLHQMVLLFWDQYLRMAFHWLANASKTFTPTDTKANWSSDNNIQSIDLANI